MVQDCETEARRVSRLPIRIKIVVAICLATGCEKRSEVAEPVRVQAHLATIGVRTQLAETILVDDIRLESGRCYTARLRQHRSGDRGSSGSQCTLLEDGTPLATAHASHDSIRRLGGGRYSHWTEARLYFSASDSSDPRSNGRRYELVSTEHSRRRSAEISTTASRSIASFHIPESCSVRPLRVEILNRDARNTAFPWIKRVGDPSSWSKRSIVKSITNTSMRQEEKAIAIWRFLVDWSRGDFPASEGAEAHDPVKLVNVYGYGFCDDSAAAFCSLAKAAGIPARSYALSGHVVAEAFYGEDWHMFDPHRRIFYRKEDGDIASVQELETRTDLITRQPLDALGMQNSRIAEFFASREDNAPFEAESGPAHTLSPMLLPGDRVVFDFAKQDRVYRDHDRTWHLPLSYGNGRLTRTIALDHAADNKLSEGSIVHVTWPYVILGAKISGPASTSNVHAEASSDGGKVWTSVHLSSSDRRGASLDAWIENQPRAVYSFWLRIRNSENGATQSPESVTLTLDFQFAPRAHTYVAPGLNEILVFTQPASERAPLDWEGVDLKLVWDELR